MAIILAGGSGSRMASAEQPKQFLPLGSGSVISRSMHTFCSLPNIEALLVVVPQENYTSYETHFSQYTFDKPLHIIPGGQTRQESSWNAIEWVMQNSPKTKLVAIHDAARPFVSTDLIQETLKVAQEEGAAEPGIPMQDTVIRADKGRLIEPLQREELYAVQTPQCFQVSLIWEAHQHAKLHKTQNITDDASLIHSIGKPVHIVPGDVENFKITYSSDYERAKTVCDRKK